MSESNQSNSMSTSIPIPVVDPDKLPREKAINYNEIAAMVGNLYLESRRRVILMNEEFTAVIAEYQTRLDNAQQEIVRLQGEVMGLRQELERRK